jgi:hypothetical protein
MVAVELQQLANSIGIKDVENVYSKPMLVRAIQRQRGEDPCFATDKRYTCNNFCEWRADCVKLRAVWLR